MTHVIEVRKDGYHGWIKKLPVVESMVVEARVLMIPLEISTNPVYPFYDVNNLGTTTDEEEFLINKRFFDLEILFGLASSTNENSLTQLLSNQIEIAKNQSVIDANLKNTNATSSTTTLDIPDYFVDLGILNPKELENLVTLNNEIAWLSEGNIIMHWVGKDGEEPFYYCNFEGCKQSFELDWEEEILRFDFMPGRGDVWVVLNQAGLWAVEIDDRSTRNIQPIYQGENLDFRIDSNRIFVLDAGIFYELNI
jgi:hypothetical protein